MSVVHRVLAAVPAELQDGHLQHYVYLTDITFVSGAHHDGQGEAAEKHHKHTADVLNTEGVSLGVLALVLRREKGLYKTFLFLALWSSTYGC